MPNNKKKSLRDIASDNMKGDVSLDDIAENIHPNSRKAKQVGRAIARDEKSQTRKRNQKARVKPKVDRFLWFKYRIDPETKVLSKHQIMQLVQEFIDRNDQEIEEAQTGETVEGLISTKKMETEEFRKSGFEVPDLMNGIELKKLREWDGDYNGMHRIKTIRVFPPIAGMMLPPPTVNTPKKTGDASAEDLSATNGEDRELPSGSAVLPEGASIQSAVNNEMSVIAATVALGDATDNEQGIQMMMMMEGENITMSGEDEEENQ